jgi:hypothetical protein
MKFNYEAVKQIEPITPDLSGANIEVAIEEQNFIILSKTIKKFNISLDNFVKTNRIEKSFNFKYE